MLIRRLNVAVRPLNRRLTIFMLWINGFSRYVNPVNIAAADIFYEQPTCRLGIMLSQITPTMK